MKRFVLSVGLVTVAVSCFGREITGLKADHEKRAASGKAYTDKEAAFMYGSKEVHDLCISKEWDADEIVDSLDGMEFNEWFVNNSYPFVSLQKRGVFMRIVAKKSRLSAIAVLNITPPAFVTEEDKAAVFSSKKEWAKPSITEASAPGSLPVYAVMQSAKLGKQVRYAEQDAAFYADWLLLGGTLKWASHVQMAKTFLKREAEKGVKVWLRKQGKTFVTRNGVNPIEEAMKPLVDALNAPKLAGLEAAMRGVGIDYPDRGDLTAVWSAIEAEKDDIFYGRKAAHPPYDGGIILLLGPDGYNAWVKAFNEGEK